MPVQGCSTLRAAPRRRRPSEALPPRRPGRAREVQARSSAAPRIAPPVCTAPGHGDSTRGRRTARHPWPRPWTRALRSAPCSCAPASGAALGDPPAVAGTGTTWGPRSYPSPGRVRFETQASPRLRLAPQGARINVHFGLAWVPGPPPTPAQQRQLDGAFGGRAASLEQWGAVRRRPSSDLGLAQGAWRRGVRSPHREVPFPARVHLAGSGVRNRVRLTRSLRLCSRRHAKAGRLRRQRPEMQATHGRRLRGVPGGAGRFQATRGKRVTAFIGTTAQGERRGDHAASVIRSEVSR